MACGRDRLERSSLVRKQVKKQPIALKNDLKRNRNTFPKINPISRFNDAHIMLLSSIYFLFLLFFFFRSCGVYNQGVRGGGGDSCWVVFEIWNQPNEGKISGLRNENVFECFPYLMGRQMMVLLASWSWHVGGLWFFVFGIYGIIPVMKERVFLYYGRHRVWGVLLQIFLSRNNF